MAESHFLSPQSENQPLVGQYSKPEHLNTFPTVGIA
jgi:hypothetical protein